MPCNFKDKDFQFWMPLEVIKAGDGDMRIGGVASDENSQDLQGEKVFVDGLDISYLLKRGAFNWDHQKDPGSILGEVDTARKSGGKLYVEGFLYPTVDKSLEVYRLMKGLKESGSKRKLGLSVEGKVKERDTENGKVIKKAWIKNVAVTYNPINQGAYVDLIKSLGNFAFKQCTDDCSKCTVCETDSKSPEGVSKVENTEPLAGGVNLTVEKAVETVEKAVENSIKIQEKVPEQITPSGDTKKEEVDKALAAGYDTPASSGGISGSAKRKEDLDKEEKVVTYDESHFGLKKKKDKFTKSELTECFETDFGCTPKMSELMTDLIFKAIQIPGYLRTRRGKLERVKPFSRELAHEMHRMATMSENALMTRAAKITHPDKLLHFWSVASNKGMTDLAAVIKHEGKRRLGLKDRDFADVSKEVGYAS
jgi:hypothetical protein